MSAALSWRRHAAIAAAFVIAVWAAGAAAGWDEMTAVRWIPSGDVGAGLVIVSLLIVDVVMPLPGTVVMATAGSLLGPIVGAGVNTVGLLGATEVGRLLGRGGSRWAPAASTAPSPFAIAATRGVPIVSEAVALAAGATGASRREVAWPAALGGAVVGTAHAIAGSAAGDRPLLVIAAGVAAGAATMLIVWLVGVGDLGAWSPRRRNAPDGQRE